MVCDTHGRKIDYLRVAVTDRCNLRCTYCMPAEGIVLKEHTDILSLEEIVEAVTYAVKTLGFRKVRLTGGEPLLRRNLPVLVQSISDLSGIEDLALTTNGVLLEKYAKVLQQAGLARVNISLDSLNPEKYREITRGGDLSQVLQGISAARAAGLSPIKINVVVIPGYNEEEKAAFLEFGIQEGVEIRFIKQMDLAQGHWYGVEGNSNVGQCNYCNRLRLTADGFLKPCLFSDLRINVRELGVAEAFTQAIGRKPLQGQKNTKELMHQIGG